MNQCIKCRISICYSTEGTEQKCTGGNAQRIPLSKNHNGKRKEAAKELGISERTLYRKINEFGIK